MADEVDFHSKFIVMNDQNKELLQVGLSQRKMMYILFVLLGIVFIVLIAFNAIKTKDLKDLLKDIRDIKDSFGN